LRAGGTLAVHLTDATHYGAALLFTTGSRVHLDTLCAMARYKVPSEAGGETSVKVFGC
jgi:hypothetical protein